MRKHLGRRLILGLVLVTVGGCNQEDNKATPPPTPLVSQPEYVSRSVKITDEQGLGIQPGQWWEWDVVVSPEMDSPQIALEFETIAGKDVEVMIVDDLAYKNWQANVAGKALYFSGRVNAGRAEVPLPKTGTYVFVVSNTFSVVTSKSVRVKASLDYGFWR